MELLLLLILTVIIILIVYFISREKNLPPGPIIGWLPVFGHSLLIRSLSKKYGGFHEATKFLANKYNCKLLGLQLGGEFTVVVFGRDILRELMFRDDFIGRPKNFFIQLRSMNTNKGITMTDGDLWQEQRQFLVKHLHDLGFGKSLMDELIQDELQRLIEDLKDGGTNIDLSNAISFRVLSILWKLVAGTRLERNQVQELLELMRKRARAFDMAGGLLNTVPWLRFIAPSFTGFDLIQILNKRLFGFINQTIEEHKITYSKDKTRDFIDHFLHEMYEEKLKNSFTDEQLMMVCLDLFIAGSQTTTHTLDFAFIRMINHPEIQEKVYSEIKNVMTDKRLPNTQDKLKLKYTDAVLQESMRTNHVVQVMGPRRVVMNTKLAGYYLPRNTTLLLNMTSVMQDKEIWGDPENFRPERFLESGSENNYEFFPFSHGKRKCPGNILAKNFIFTIFSGILAKYQLSVSDDEEIPSLIPTPGITLTPKPYKVKLIPRT